MVLPNSEGGEVAAIERLRHRLPAPPPGQVWIGDDAAVVPDPGGALLLTTDAVVAGVHVDLSLVGLDDLGWKALTAAASDIAAMGGRADQALVAVVGPPDTDLDRLAAGVADAAAVLGCDVVGGDLSTGPVLVVSVAVVGHVPPGEAPVLRSGARPGDAVLVTGALGASAAGLARLRADPGAEADRHRRPVARLAEGSAARRAGATAMIDVSDGLATDVRHMAEASGVRIELSVVPVADGSTRDLALTGGEDYELIVATPDPDGLRARFAADGLAPPVEIGRCVPGEPDVLLDGAPLTARGYEHPWSAGRPTSGSEATH